MKQQKNGKSSGFKSLTSAAKQYLGFMAIAQIISTIVSLFFVLHENALCGFVRMLLIFDLAYLIVVIIIIGMSSRYNRERNMIAAIIPAFMCAVGFLIAFWLNIEIVAKSVGLGDIFVVLSTMIFAPAVTSFLDKTLNVKAWKLYASSVTQIIISAAILWLEIRYFL